MSRIAGLLLVALSLFVFGCGSDPMSPHKAVVVVPPDTIATVVAADFHFNADSVWISLALARPYVEPAHHFEMLEIRQSRGGVYGNNFVDFESLLNLTSWVGLDSTIFLPAAEVLVGGKRIAVALPRKEWLDKSDPVTFLFEYRDDIHRRTYLIMGDAWSWSQVMPDGVTTARQRYAAHPDP